MVKLNPSMSNSQFRSSTAGHPSARMQRAWRSHAITNRQLAAASGAVEWINGHVGRNLLPAPVNWRSSPSRTRAESVFSSGALAFSPSGLSWTTGRAPAPARIVRDFP
jgi:hypothetical protein